MSLVICLTAGRTANLLKLYDDLVNSFQRREKMLGRKRKKAVKSTHKIIDKSNKNNHVDYQEVYRNIMTNIEYTAVGKICLSN